MLWWTPGKATPPLRVMDPNVAAAVVAGLALVSQIIGWIWGRGAQRHQQLEAQLDALQREWDQSVGARLPERVGALEDGRRADAESMGRLAERLHALRDQLALLQAGM